MPQNNLKLVIVGHVDHGKSTLIGRLLFDTHSLPPDKIAEIKKTSQSLGRKTEFAFLLDHLQEEREQGITIETTQTFFKTGKRQYVIIDAPGHVEFVKNMITGASQAEAAILIIDAAEGLREQTRRHAYILSLLGLKQIIVALNKMDLVNFRKSTFNKVRDQAQKFLESIKIQATYYIPMVALAGENVAIKSKKMKWYQGPTLLKALDSFKNQLTDNRQGLILPVQDVYKIGNKRMIVGKIESGTLRKGQRIKILPAGQITKIKTIEKFKKQLRQAAAGENIGLTITDPLFIERGHLICQPHKEPILTDKFEAHLFWMGQEDFDKNEAIVLRCATQEMPVQVKAIQNRMNSSSLKIISLQADKLKNLEVGHLTIKTKTPMAIQKFNDLPCLGKFVLIKNDNITAGGIIV